jgi:hypothetical protein
MTPQKTSAAIGSLRAALMADGYFPAFDLDCF